MSPPVPPAPEPRDPARQPERTRMSWRRTVLTITVVALLAGRMVLAAPSVVAALGIAATAGGWLAILVLAGRRITAMAAARPDEVRWAVPLTALITLGYAGLGVALLVLA